MEKKLKTPFILLHKLFPSLLESEILLLQEHTSIIRLKKNQHLFLSGDSPRSLFCIEKGCLKVIRENQEGSSIITSIAAQGHTIGAREIFGDFKYRTSAMAIKESEILCIEKNIIFELSQKKSDFLLQIMKSFCIELDHLEKRIAADLYMPAKKRIAAIIYDLHSLFSENGQLSFESPLNRRDIAELADVTPETVSRVLSDFKQAKILKAQGALFHLLDINAFRYEIDE